MTPLFVFDPSHPVDGPVARVIGSAVIAAGVDTYGAEAQLFSRYFYWGGRPEALDELTEFTSVLNRSNRSRFLSVWRAIAKLANGVMVIPPQARLGRPAGGTVPSPIHVPDDVALVIPELLTFVPPRPLAQSAWADIITCDDAGTSSVFPKRGGNSVPTNGYRIRGSDVLRLLGPLAVARLPDHTPEQAIIRLRCDPVLGRHPLIGIYPTSKFPLTEVQLAEMDTLPRSDMPRTTRATVSPQVAASVTFPGLPQPTSAPMPSVIPPGVPQFGGFRVAASSSDWTSVSKPQAPQAPQATWPPTAWPPPPAPAPATPWQTPAPALAPSAWQAAPVLPTPPVPAPAYQQPQQVPPSQALPAPAPVQPSVPPWDREDDDGRW